MKYDCMHQLHLNFVLYNTLVKEDSRLNSLMFMQEIIDVMTMLEWPN